MRKNKLRFTLSLAMFLGGLLSVPPGVGAAPSPPSQIGCRIVLQFENYSGGDDVAAAGASSLHSNRIAVREAVMGLSGTLTSRVEYEFEAGTSRCPASGTGGPEVTLKDASVFYNLGGNLRIGMLKGHILRGFQLHEECTAGLAAEKTRFAPAFAPCHPTGAACEFAFALGERAAVEGQATYLNGSDLTLEDEHDINLGLIFQTPFDELAISGYYNDVRLNLGTFDPTTFESLFGDGYRAGLGIDFETHRTTFRSEYYIAKAFSLGAGGSPSSDHPEEREMTAFYLQVGHTIPTGMDALPHVCPYVRYQHWDKAADLEDGFRSAYLTTGVTLSLTNESSFLKLDYESHVSRPSGSPREDARLIVRLQINT